MGDYQSPAFYIVFTYYYLPLPLEKDCNSPFSIETLMKENQAFAP